MSVLSVLQLLTVSKNCLSSPYQSNVSPHLNPFSLFSCLSEQGPSRYILVDTEMTWHKARTYCQSSYTDLVSVRNMSENDHISSLLSEKSWIGLTRKNWGHWSDQSLTSFTKWNAGQPHSNEKPVGFCAVVNTTTGTWWDVDCKEKHYFICQKVLLQHKMTFQLKFQSKADLNDPTVQQQILEQVMYISYSFFLSFFFLHRIAVEKKLACRRQLDNIYSHTDTSVTGQHQLII